MKNEYNTKQRSLILNFLKENTAHVSVSDIISGLEKQGIKIGTATVYRTLDKLCETGFVRKFAIDEHIGTYFQFVEGASCNEHFHLKCTKCGNLIHLNSDFLKTMEERIYKEHAFTVSSGKTIIYGICNKCFENNNGKTKG